MNPPEFGKLTRPGRERALADLARTCLEVSVDMGNEGMAAVARRVLAQLMADQPPRLGDIRAISMTLSSYFR